MTTKPLLGNAHEPARPEVGAAINQDKMTGDRDLGTGTGDRGFRFEIPRLSGNFSGSRQYPPENPSPKSLTREGGDDRQIKKILFADADEALPGREALYGSAPLVSAAGGGI